LRPVFPAAIWIYLDEQVREQADTSGCIALLSHDDRLHDRALARYDELTRDGTPVGRAQLVARPLAPDGATTRRR
jgi:hypothetical protein